MIDHLHVSKIYGSNTLDISFNNDITILTGRNGTGKTTILNFISTIASGRIDKLHSMDFESVILDYTHKEKKRHIKFNKTKDGNLLISWKGQQYILDADKIKSVKFRRNKAENIIYKELSDEIKSEINFLYLPLSREDTYFTQWSEKNNRYMSEESERDFYGSSGYQNRRRNFDKSLKYINELIRENQRQVMLKFDELNKDMRQKMFRTMFSYFDSGIKDLLTSVLGLHQRLQVNELKQALLETDLLSIDDQHEFDAFFQRFIDEEDVYDIDKLANSDNNPQEIIKFIINMIQIEKMMKWQYIVQEANSQKKLQAKSKKIFIDIVNSFFGETGKQLLWDDSEGMLKFISKNSSRQLDIDRMSSGEKQIVIFFAFLIFSISNLENGIYMVDEPEVSLHVSWQKRFISSVLEAAPGLQLIFATHSPEIIGKYRDKCVAVGRCFKWN